MHKYTEEEKNFLRKFVPGHSHKEITEEFNRRFFENVTVGQIKGSIKRYNLNTGRTGRFEKGHIPANKGTHPKTVGRMGETQFKKGNLPHNTKPLGYERVSKDGYVEVKMAMRRNDTCGKNNFVAKHRLIWEEANGPIPSGCNVIFLDGDKRNFSLDNLTLVTNAENLELTRSGLRNDTPQFTKTGILIAKSAIATRNAKKRKQRRDCMQLKNKTEREQFLKSYRKWVLIYELPELELKFYQYTFSNGTKIVATEYACMRFISFGAPGAEYRKSVSVKYHLILHKSDKYKAKFSDIEHQTYNPVGDSLTSIIEYLTKTKPEIDLTGNNDV